MFLNERTIPLTLQQIIVVRSRLGKYHSKQPKLEKSEMKRWAGYHGERMVDHYLQRMPDDKFTIFRDLNLQEKERFQIDAFLYNQCFGLILEMKNILGTLYFDKHSKQMIRTWKDEKEGFANPLLQAQMQQVHLQSWLNKHKFPPFPIVWLVVFSSPATILETTPGNEQIFQKIIHANLLQQKLFELEVMYSSEKMNKSDLKKLSRLLLKENTPHLKNILQKYDIPRSEIKTGVRCPACNFVPMQRVSGKWDCPNCHNSSKEAHIQSLYDYLLVNQPTITNRECREFLHTPTRSITLGALSTLPHIGTKRGSTYQLAAMLQNPDDYFLLPKTKIWIND
jgi:ribosomal protein L37AE/L43A